MKSNKRLIQNYESEYSNYSNFKKYYLQDPNIMIEVIKNNANLLKKSPYASKLIKIKD